jgi:hypothetical protein
MKRISFLPAVWAVLVSCGMLDKSVLADDLVLASNGASDYVIALPASPEEPVRTAARELQEHL